MPISTVAVLAARYRGKQSKLDATRTHALADNGTVTLCGRIAAEHTTETDHIEEPTCPTCRKRDPRLRTGAPFVLATLLQLR